ncbi:MAG TPA: hypothetical protein VE262_26015 [Blastocatellia bacterium]|nr:hypothetical protein [Blastocatellia bacterium]
MMNLRRSIFAMILTSVIFAGPSSAAAQTESRAEVEKKIEALRAQLSRLEKEFLEPSAEDRAAFAAFLRQPDTGLTRLLPREKYGQKLTIPGGGYVYSFRRLTHEYGYGSDISLEQDRFKVGFAGADYGFFVNLGDIPLQGVTLDHPGLQYLVEYKVPASPGEMHREKRRAGSLFEANGFKYGDSVAAVNNTTYALRSIEPQDADTLIAFRVVRRDADGSLTLLWKVLKRFPAPHVARDRGPGK